MLLTLLVLSCGLSLLAFVLLARFLDSLAWRRSLLAFKLSLPSDLMTERVSHWLALINGATHAHHLALLPAPPVAIEIVGTKKGIDHYLLMSQNMRGAILSTLRAALPGLRVEEATDDYLTTRSPLSFAAEATLTSHRRPLRSDLAETASQALLASLQPLYGDETVIVQWIITGGGIPRVVSSANGRQSQGRRGGQTSADAEALRAERAKQQAPLLRAVVRVGVQAQARKRQYTLFGRAWASLRTLNAPGAGIVRRWWLSPSLITSRVQRLALPLTAWPLTVNTKELAGLIGLITSEGRLPGLSVSTARQLPPPTTGLSSGGAIFGLSNYPGMTHRKLALSTSDRLRHCWVLGPTGAGKSTLLANLITQDMTAGSGMVVIDARGDLIPDILSRVPASRFDDVIVMDPSQSARPVSFNILGIGTGSEEGRERAVDHVLHIFNDLYHSSWGPRTADILRAGLLTLISTKAKDGSAFTLCELPELLTNAQFRAFVTGQQLRSTTLISFWQWYEGLSEAARAEIIGPVLNKLRAFTFKTPIRLLLGHSQGIDLTDIFTKRRILLVPLSKGTLGVETAQLVGSLLVASLWQVTLGRVRIPPERRRPVWCYADEFQETVRLPIDLADMLAQARGLGLGLILAHQHLGQLPEVVKTAVLSTARTQVLFQLDYEDARVMERRFGPLTTQDLMGLGQYEIALRPCLGGRTASVVTGTTLPLPESSSDGAKLAEASRERYGVARAEIETGLLTRLQGDAFQRGYGRTPWEATP
jgi:hypothetical protein